MLILFLFIIGIFSRIIPHLPNFVPLAAIALFSGAYLNRKYAVIVPLALYIISDLIVGLHNVVFFTWGSIILISFLGTALRNKKTAPKILGFTLISSLLFFIITNFGVWAMGWYPRTLSGLVQCYVMAIPFFRTSLLSNLVYAGVLFGVYELLSDRLKDKKLKAALLLN